MTAESRSRGIRSEVLGDPDVLSALGEGGDRLTDPEIETLVILLDPRNDPLQAADSVTEMLEDVTTFTGWDIDDDKVVARRLCSHYDRLYGWGSFTFEHIREADGTCDVYEVGIPVRTSHLWLMIINDIKHLGDARFGLTGLRSALHTAMTLRADYDTLRHIAAELGLLQT